MSHNYSKDQMGTNNQVAQQQLALQQQYLSKYQDYVNKLIAGGGYLPGVKEALTSTGINQIPQAYSGIARNLQTAAMERGLSGGGALPGGGGYLAGYGNLLSQEEQAKAATLNNIISGGQQNIAQGESGLLNAAGVTSGVGSSALGSATSAANQATQSSGGLLGSVIGGGLGVLGAYVGKPGCWVAAEIYGWYSPEMLSIREWILSTPYMRRFAKFYLQYGELWAVKMRTNSILRFFTKKLFSWFLGKANA